MWVRWHHCGSPSGLGVCLRFYPFLAHRPDTFSNFVLPSMTLAPRFLESLLFFLGPVSLCTVKVCPGDGTISSRFQHVQVSSQDCQGTLTSDLGRAHVPVGWGLSPQSATAGHRCAPPCSLCLRTAGFLTVLPRCCLGLLRFLCLYLSCLPSFSILISDWKPMA